MDKTTICNGWDRIKEELCVGLIHMMHEYTLHWRWRRRQRSAVTESYLSLLLLILNLDESICSAVNYRKWNFRLKENGRLPTKADIRAVYCDVALMKYVLFSFTLFFASMLHSKVTCSCCDVHVRTKTLRKRMKSWMIVTCYKYFVSFYRNQFSHSISVGLPGFVWTFAPRTCSIAKLEIIPHNITKYL